jgi:hypothetical protein
MSEEFFYEEDRPKKKNPAWEACEAAWANEVKRDGDPGRQCGEVPSEWATFAAICKEIGAPPSFVTRAVFKQSVLRQHSNPYAARKLFKNQLKSASFVNNCWDEYVKALDIFELSIADCANPDSLELAFDIQTVFSCMQARKLDPFSASHMEEKEKVVGSVLLDCMAVTRVAVLPQSARIMREYGKEALDWLDASNYRPIALEEIAGITVEDVRKSYNNLTKKAEEDDAH